MKIKRISKTSVKYFFAAAILTALFIAFCAAFVIAEKNTAAIGISKVSTPLSLEPCDGGAILTVNDREFEFSLLPLYKALESRGLYVAVGIFLLL